MGGGDLNLKKSWHTQTLRNIENVWKLEQKVVEDQKRNEQRQKELKEERERAEMMRLQEEAGLIKRRGERVEWMYAGASLSAQNDEEKEAYLLGRKRVDRVLAESAEAQATQMANQASSSMLANRQLVGGLSAENALRDMQNKLREDPLFAIRMREKQSVDTVLNNPLKLKQLREQQQQPERDSAASSSAKLHRSRDDQRSRSRSPIRSSRRHDSSERRHRRSRSRSQSQARNRNRDTPSAHRRNRSRSRSLERNRYDSREHRYKGDDRTHSDRRDDRRMHDHERTEHERYRDRSRSPRDRHRNDRRRHDARPTKQEQRPSNETTADEDRRAKLARMQQNAQKLHEERQERVARLQERERLEAQQPAPSERDAGEGGGHYMANIGRMMYGVNNEKSTSGSSMSQGALHDRLRRQMYTNQRSDRGD